MSLYEQLQRDRITARIASLDAARRHADVLSLRSGLTGLGMQLAALRLRHALLRKYRADQPRVPAGNPDGGQWTDEGGSGGDIASKPWSSVPTAFASEKPRGHHFVPRSIYRNLPLQPETRKAFDDASTGRLHAEPHRWSEGHREYNEAVRERLGQFLNSNNTTPERMTPDQARDFVKEVRSSKDPRIRSFNLRIYRNEMMYWLRRAPRAD
jgi:hypothetical protein